jgi:hypothetical protein
MRAMSAGFLLLIFSANVDAQRWVVSQDLLRERVIGLLDLPEIVGRHEDCPSASKPTPRFSTPSTGQRPVGQAYLRRFADRSCGLFFKRRTGPDEELPYEESGYEVRAAVVHQRRGNWFRIAIPNGSAWIERSDTSDFLPYPELLTERLAYLKGSWEGELRDAAGARVVRRVPAQWNEVLGDQIQIEVLGTTQQGDQTWLHVRLVTDLLCGNEKVSLFPPAEGWVPAYRPDGTTTAWFYSRGC